jgi:acetyltransferase-like isoleucine patch superfamily enzyme
MKERLKLAVRRNRYLYAIATILVGKKPLSGGIVKRIIGHRNRFTFPPSAIFVNCKVDIQGSNNHIRIGDFCSFANVTFWIRGDDNHVDISDGVKFARGGSLHIEDNQCIIAIGRNSTFEDAHLAATEPRSRIVVGEDCMFAYDIDVRTGDSHSIIDMVTNRRINFAKDVSIDDHVWISAHCSILKGATIARNSVVATRSVVTKAFDREGIVLGGNPCRILKEQITWDRRRIYPHPADRRVPESRATSANGSEFIRP